MKCGEQIYAILRITWFSVEFHDFSNRAKWISFFWGWYCEWSHKTTGRSNMLKFKPFLSAKDIDYIQT